MNCQLPAVVVSTLIHQIPNGLASVGVLAPYRPPQNSPFRTLGDQRRHRNPHYHRQTDVPQTLDFTIKLDWVGGYQGGDHFVGKNTVEKKGRLDAGGTADLEMTYAVELLFGDMGTPAASILNRAAMGFDPLASLAEGSTLDTDLSELKGALALVLALVVLVGFLYWAERRYPGPLKPRERDLALTFCAWCVYRDGDDCTHPESPVIPAHGSDRLAQHGL